MRLRQPQASKLRIRQTLYNYVRQDLNAILHAILCLHINKLSLLMNENAGHFKTYKGYNMPTIPFQLILKNI